MAVEAGRMDPLVRHTQETMLSELHAFRKDSSVYIACAAQSTHTLEVMEPASTRTGPSLQGIVAKNMKHHARDQRVGNTG